MKLNPQQKEAVIHKKGPLLIIAGAGTGKTKVIVERIAHIVKEELALPSQILALTFTEKAAAEMKERVDEVLPLSYEEPLVSTFHSFADKILRQEAIYLGLDGNYSLLTQSESYILFRRHLFEFPLKKFRPLGNPTKFISDILSHFSRLQDEAVTPEEYLEYAKNLKSTNDEEEETKNEALELSQTYKMYSEIKIVNSKLDFGDLIVILLKLFREKPNILKKYHDAFKYILVDEYQDTNYTQNILVNLLALGKEINEADVLEKSELNITVVGDDDQAIYKFRGAAISNILQFKENYPSAKSVVLTENYRSTQKILDTAYRLIKHNDPYRLEVTEKIDKKLTSSEKGSENDVRLIRTKTSDFEAERIASEISKLIEQGKKYSDIAILARANSHIDEIVNTLRYREIPYKLGGSRSLYQRPEIQTLISFLKTVAQYSDEISMFNVLSLKEWEFVPRDVVELIREARSSKLSTYEVIEKVAKKDLELKLSKNALPALQKIVNIYEQAQKMLVNGKSAGEILFKFFEESGLKEKYLSDESGKYMFAVENLNKYFKMIENFWKNNKGTNLYEYLDYLNYSIEVGETPNVDVSAFDDYDAVNVLTIHSSKGLEFPVVFVVNMVSDRFPSRNRSDAIPIPAALIKEVLPVGGESAEHIMEERRLAYVAFTRAKEILYLTGADFYALAKMKKKLSPFIYEALEEVGSEVEEDEKVVDIKVKEEKDLVDYEKLGIKMSNEFSYTQIHTYEMCPAQYKYEYVLKIPVEPSSALSFGSTVHNTLKQLYEQLNSSKEGVTKLPQVEDVLEMYKKNWIDVGYEDKKQMEMRYNSGIELFKEYFTNLFSKDDNVLYLEKDFQYSIDDFKIRGRIDRIDLLRVENGVKYVEVIDYKTGKIKDKKEAQKEWQLQLYSYIVEEIFGVKVEKASYIFVEHGTKVEVRVDSKRKEAVLNMIREIVGKIREGDFALPPGHDCYYCKYKEICDDAII